MRSLFLFLSITLFISCNDDNDEPEVDLIGFMNIKPGNYWIYDWYEVTPTGQEKMLGLRDSVYISKDTLINGRVAYIRRGNHFGSGRVHKLVIFDSANAVYTFPKREILFSLDPGVNYSTFIEEGAPDLGTVMYALQEGTTNIEVPAGTFTCVNYQGVVKFFEATNPTLYNDNFYSDQIGFVKMSTFFIGNPNRYEMRLVRAGRQF